MGTAHLNLLIRVQGCNGPTRQDTQAKGATQHPKGKAKPHICNHIYYDLCVADRLRFKRSTKLVIHGA